MYDGAKAHVGKDSLELINSFAIPKQMPPHSSPFNAIEHCWKIAKIRANKLISSVMISHETDESEFHALVEIALESLSQE